MSDILNQPLTNHIANMLKECDKEELQSILDMIVKEYHDRCIVMVSKSYKNPAHIPPNDADYLEINYNVERTITLCPSYELVINGGHI